MKAILAFCLLLGAAANAATVVQSESFAITRTYAGTGEVSIPISFSTTVIPFNSSLGTLQSFSLSWVIGGTISGQGAPVSGGSATLTAGGSMTLNGTGFASSQASGFAMSLPDQPFSANVTMSSPADHTFPVPWDSSYDPTLLGRVTGDTPFAFALTGGSTMKYADVASVTFDTQVVATVTYTYAPVPEPSALILGLLSSLPLMRRRR